MIDYRDGDLLTLSQAAAELPATSRGAVAANTLFCWAHYGRKIPRRLGGGVAKLETIRIGGRRYTSRPALARFFAALSGHDQAPPPEAPRVRRRTARAVQRGTAHAMAFLAARGVVSLDKTPAQRRAERGLEV